jgi:hypothetical protein
MNASALPKIPPSGAALLPHTSWQHSSSPGRLLLLHSGQSGQKRTPNRCSNTSSHVTRKPSQAAKGSHANISRLCSYVGKLPWSFPISTSRSTLSRLGFFRPPHFRVFLSCCTIGSLRRVRAKRSINKLCFSSGDIVMNNDCPYATRYECVT